MPTMRSIHFVADSSPERYCDLAINSGEGLLVSTSLTTSEEMSKSEIISRYKNLGFSLEETQALIENAKGIAAAEEEGSEKDVYLWRTNHSRIVRGWLFERP